MGFTSGPPYAGHRYDDPRGLGLYSSTFSFVHQPMKNLDLSLALLQYAPVLSDPGQVLHMAKLKPYAHKKGLNSPL